MSSDRYCEAVGAEKPPSLGRYPERCPAFHTGCQDVSSTLETYFETSSSLIRRNIDGFSVRSQDNRLTQTLYMLQALRLRSGPLT